MGLTRTRVDLKYNDWCLIRQGEDTEGETVDNVKMEAEVRAMNLQAKEHQGVSATLQVRRKAWRLPWWQWIGICLPTQGTQVLSLVWKIRRAAEHLSPRSTTPELAL